MNVVIYARFSSHSQNEASIERQLKICYEYAKNNGYAVIGEYIDRALTGTNDKRPQFQKMIRDSAHKQFKAILLYQFDRFARDMYDNLNYERKLIKNGVQILSVNERFSDNASGRFQRNIVLAYNQFYSEELSQKITDGLRLKAGKGLYVGGGVALGYRINKIEIGRNGKGEILYENHFELDPLTAPMIQKIFEMYATGSTVVKINEYLNGQGIKSSRGSVFNKNSLHKILQNKKYIGIFVWRDIEILDGIPRIIADDLFFKVQQIMETNKKAPARARAKEDYILTTKLFCGKCKSSMIGVSSTSKTGKIHHYYACNKARAKLCDKKQVKKQWIEDLVVAKCRDILTEENIDKIAAAVINACEKNRDDTNLKRLQKLLKENEKAMDNLFKALETGQVTEQITKRIQERSIEQSEIEKQLTIEQKDKVIITAPKIKFFLTELKKGDINDLKKRKALINVFVNKIYLYDDKITFILNVGDTPITLDESLQKDIEQAAECAYINNLTPPKQY